MEFEILISTMNRTDPGFLDPMFALVGGPVYPILIVNQTTPDQLLETDLPNVRVINSMERGLSQSRNLAIDNARGEVCLVADDDVLYLPDFDKVVISAHRDLPEVPVITFKMEDEEGHDFRKYPDISIHNTKTVESVNGVVISFKRDKLRKAKVYYNPHFGLGCTFGSANEYVFMRNVLSAGLQAGFVSKPILRHPVISSGQDHGSDRALRARAALQYKYYGFWSYLWVIKYCRFLLAHGYIGRRELKQKIKLGFEGIRTYRKLLKEKKETR